MRENKYRVWHRKEKCWHYFLLHCGQIHPTLDEGTFAYENQCEYTGLKDKDSVEIYEGDIMHLRSIHRGKLTTYWDDAQVFFRNDGWKVGYPGGQGQDLWYRWVLDGNSEVIGNRYENPELLEAE